ncbi:leucine-rich repeat domain-containing protein [Spirosoma areae]
MAIRSLLLAFVITGVLGYCFTFGLTDPNSILKKIPDWGGIVLFLGCGLLYLLATWWAFKGFSEHKLTAIVSLGFCTFGLGIYAAVFLMEFGPKTIPGQYDYDFTTLDTTEKAIVAQIADESGLELKNAIFTEHWHVAESTAAESTAANMAKGFRICVQKGHVTALNLSGHPIPHLTLFSRLPGLGDLYLKNCGLSNLSDLQSTKLNRLDVSGNQISDLKTLRGCPNVQWLFAANNRLKTTDGIEQFRQLVSHDFTGNPLP